MSQQLLVTNLSKTMDDLDLARLFATSGQVRTSTVIVDGETGRSQGCGLVEMETDEQAFVAMTKLNGHTHVGLVLGVAWTPRRADDPAATPPSQLYGAMNMPGEDAAADPTGPLPGEFGDRGGSGHGGGPFYVATSGERGSADAAAPWVRFVPIAQPPRLIQWLENPPLARPESRG